MKTHATSRAESGEERQGASALHNAAQLKQGEAATMVDARAASSTLLRHQDMANNSAQAMQLKQRAEMMAGGAQFDIAQRVEDEEMLQGKFETVQRVEEEEPVQGKFDAAQRVEDDELFQGKFAATATTSSPTQLEEKPNQTGMPNQLKAGIESLSGMDLSDVRVHRNSSKPAQLSALAYAQGNDIHLGPGQEQHLPHEAWHVVQQRQGRVRETVLMAGVGVNDDVGLEREADLMGGRAVLHGGVGTELESIDRPSLLKSPSEATQLTKKKGSKSSSSSSAASSSGTSNKKGRATSSPSPRSSKKNKKAYSSTAFDQRVGKDDDEDMDMQTQKIDQSEASELSDAEIDYSDAEFSEEDRPHSANAMVATKGVKTGKIKTIKYGDTNLSYRIDTTTGQWTRFGDGTKKDVTTAKLGENAPKLAEKGALQDGFKHLPMANNDREYVDKYQEGGEMRAIGVLAHAKDHPETVKYNFLLAEKAETENQYKQLFGASTGLGSFTGQNNYGKGRVANQPGEKTAAFNSANKMFGKKGVLFTKRTYASEATPTKILTTTEPRPDDFLYEHNGIEVDSGEGRRLLTDVRVRSKRKSRQSHGDIYHSDIGDDSDTEEEKYAKHEVDTLDDEIKKIDKTIKSLTRKKRILEKALSAAEKARAPRIAAKGFSLNIKYKNEALTPELQKKFDKFEQPFMDAVLLESSRSNSSTSSSIPAAASSSCQKRKDNKRKEIDKPARISESPKRNPKKNKTKHDQVLPRASSSSTLLSAHGARHSLSASNSSTSSSIPVAASSSPPRVDLQGQALSFAPSTSGKDDIQMKNTSSSPPDDREKL